MKVVKNPITGVWELAESEGLIPKSTATGNRPCVPRLVLIVDDEEQTRQFYEKIIQQAFPSAQCLQAIHGEQAVELFIAHHPLVILMDIIMPVLDGEEAFYRIEDYCIANQWQRPRTIFCTGHSPSVGLRNIVASDPANCLLQKPIRKQTLVTALSKRLHLRPVI